MNEAPLSAAPETPVPTADTYECEECHTTFPIGSERKLGKDTLCWCCYVYATQC